MSSSLPIPDPLNPINIDCSLSEIPATITVQKNVITTGPYFTGKEIKYQLIIKNEGGQNLKNLTLVESLQPIVITEDQLGITEGIVCINAGYTAIVEYLYTITDDDLDGASVLSNTACVSSVTDEISPVCTTFDIGLATPGEMNIAKTVDSSGPYLIGDTASYTITLENTGGTAIEFVTVSDNIKDAINVNDELQIFNTGTTTSLLPNQVIEITYDHVITSEDYINGGISNEAKVFYDSDLKTKTSSISITDILEPGELKLTKAEISSGPYKYTNEEDQLTITYGVTAENIGGGTVIVDKLADSLGEPGIDFTITSDDDGLFTGSNTLTGGQVMTATYTHDITLEEFAAGAIVNNISSSGKTASVTVSDIDANQFIFEINTVIDGYSPTLTTVETRNMIGMNSNLNEVAYHQTSTNDTEFLMPTLGPDTPAGSGEYNCLVEWGDGTSDLINVWNDNAWRHDYGTQGIYTIKVTGKFIGFSFNTPGTNQMVSLRNTNNKTGYQYAKNFEPVGVVGPRTDNSQGSIVDYRLCDAPKFVDVVKFGNLIMPDGEDTAAAFTNCRNYTGDISKTQNIGQPKFVPGLNLSSTFKNCRKFNGDVSYWDISGCTNLSSMFRGCDIFNQNLDDWDISSVTTMNSMFYWANKFNNGDLGNNGQKPMTNWGTQLANMSPNGFIWMFKASGEFNQSIENWPSSIPDNTISSLSNMFNMDRTRRLELTYTRERGGPQAVVTSPNRYNQPMNSWGSKLSNCTTFDNTFAITASFNQPLDLWDTSSATTFNRMFAGALEFNQNLDTWDVGNVQNMSSMFDGALEFNQNLDTWDVGNVLKMEKMFKLAQKFNNGEVTDNSTKPMTTWAPQITALVNINEMFNSAYNFNQSLDSWGPYIGQSNLTQLKSVFLKTRKYNQPMDDWDVSNISDFTGMFSEARVFNQNLPSWDMRAARITNSMFKECFQFGANGIPNLSTWSGAVTGITTAVRMFANTKVGNTTGLAGWDLANVLSIENMFGDSNMSEDINDWGPRLLNCTNISTLFYQNAVKNPGFGYNSPLDKWAPVVGRCTTISGMFFKLGGFDQDLSDWDFRNLRRPYQGPGSTGPYQPGQDYRQTKGSARRLATGSLSTVNYDKLLIALKAQDDADGLNDFVFFDTGCLYTTGGAAEAARTHFIDNKGWLFIDGPAP